ncbi:hypothetical protein HMPREF0322_03742 [Desulfitobacterium hafniense DP7]|uniref:Uncharacterized protein n=1 Tax=Desulfitobacterium hafniense DP7 TaxID=537010 RepID=G9XRZ4_DESHA|nr:hypothetical protein HMPREF0322_03742 [Desulfitobacterium hafniense DP7]
MIAFEELAFFALTVPRQYNSNRHQPIDGKWSLIFSIPLDRKT